MEGRNFIGIEKNGHSKLFKNKNIDYIEESIKRIQAVYDNLPEEQKKFIININIFDEIKK